MSHASAPLACQRCGAALTAPPDPRAVAARCGYCGAETVLPAQVLASRRAELAAHEQRHQLEQAKKLTTGILKFTALMTLIPIVITVVVMVVVGVALGAAFYFAR